jgi:hypothetical protein
MKTIGVGRRPPSALPREREPSRRRFPAGTVPTALALLIWLIVLLAVSLA